MRALLLLPAERARELQGELKESGWEPIPPMASLPTEDRCEGCEKWFPHLAPFGPHDTMLCEDCWKSAYHHAKKKPGECGVEGCRICYEEEPV